MRLSCTRVPAGQCKHAKQWLVASALGGKEASRLAQQLTQQGRGPVPWAGIAAPLAEPSAVAPAMAEPGEGALVSAGQMADVVPGLQGRAFCFLPLPLPTGLPVHVNGLFECAPAWGYPYACQHDLGKAALSCSTWQSADTGLLHFVWALQASQCTCTCHAEQPQAMRMWPGTLACMQLLRIYKAQLAELGWVGQAEQQQARPVVWGGHGRRWQAAF